MGLAGAAQLILVRRRRQVWRGGRAVTDTTTDFYFVTSLRPEEATPARLLQLIRDHWSIENAQHHRRDRTQHEDRCHVRHTTLARNLSLLRSLAIYLFERQRRKSGGQTSLPKFQKHTYRRPLAVLRRLVTPL